MGSHFLLPPSQIRERRGASCGNGHYKEVLVVFPPPTVVTFMCLHARKGGGEGREVPKLRVCVCVKQTHVGAFPTTNGGMQNGIILHACTFFLHVWHRLASSVGAY